MVSPQQVHLRWNTHHGTLFTVLETLLSTECLVDVTLAAEGQYVRAHKVILSACSPYFQELLSIHEDKHPIIVLHDVKYSELQALLSYMYRGEVNIRQDNLPALLRVAESLQIRGIFNSNSPLNSPNSEEMDSIMEDESMTTRPVSNQSSCTSIKTEPLEDSVLPPPTATTANQGRGGGRSGQLTNQHNHINSTKVQKQTKANHANHESSSNSRTIRDDMGDSGIHEHFLSAVLSSNNSSSSHNSGGKRLKVDRKSLVQTPSHVSSSVAASSSSANNDNSSQQQLQDDPVALSIIDSYLGLPESATQNNSLHLFDLNNDESGMKEEEGSPTSPPADDDDEHSQDGHPGTEQIFRCVKCGKQYTSNKSLWRHRKFACDGKQTFSCTLCGKPFSRSDNLRRHSVVAHCVQ